MMWPLVILSRSRWARIQEALAAWPRLVERLTAEIVALKGERDRRLLDACGLLHAVDPFGDCVELCPGCTPYVARFDP